MLSYINFETKAKGQVWGKLCRFGCSIREGGEGGWKLGGTPSRGRVSEEVGTPFWECRVQLSVQASFHCHLRAGWDGDH